MSLPNSNNYTVYKHTCPNGKVYIGITMQDIRKRWNNGMGYQSNPHFFRAIVKYGWDNITHDVLYTGLTKEKACDTEKRLIAEYHSAEFAYGYNQSSGGEYGGEGVHHSHATSSAERPRGDMSVNAKRICQFDLDGNFVKTWGSEKSIGEYLGVKNPSGVSLSCNYKVIAYRGYIWLHEDEADKIRDKLRALANCTERQKSYLYNWERGVNTKYSDEKKAQRQKALDEKKIVYQFTLQGEFIKEWANPLQAAKACGFKNGIYISDCCRFKRVATAGSLWLYKKDADKIGIKVESFNHSPRSLRLRALRWGEKHNIS